MQSRYRGCQNRYYYRKKMKTFLRYITLLLVSGVIIPFCCLCHLPDMGTSAYALNASNNVTSITYQVAAKILPVLHFFQKKV